MLSYSVIQFEMMIYLMSIKPIFAKQIYTGKKEFELRKRARIKTGSRVVLYESSPVRAITGEFKAGRTFFLSFNDVRDLILRKRFRGCDRRDLKYIREGKRIQIIEVKDPMRYPSALRLNKLREIIPGFMPPRSYIRLDRDKYKPIVKALKSLG